MEGFSYRYHPRIQKALETIKKGDLGKVRFIHSSFSFPLDNPDDFRLVPALGGGALYDLVVIVSISSAW
jgi:predicted dehydrogenase